MGPPPPPIPEVVKVQAKVRQRVETRDPDVTSELRRGGMKEKWGLSLVQRIGEGGRVELCVSKVVKFSPAEKAGLKVGNTLVQINDWKIEAMESTDVALNVLLAAGFYLTLSWLNTNLPLASDIHDNVL